MPPIVTTTLSILALALKYEPELRKAYANAKTLFQMWFSGGIITAEQQKTLMDWADKHQEATLNGEVPPELSIEPDPTN